MSCSAGSTAEAAGHLNHMEKLPESSKHKKLPGHWHMPDGPEIKKEK